MNHYSKKRFYFKLLVAAAINSLIYGCIHPAIAQIIPDNTLPINTTIRVNNNTNIVENGTRVEGNLFHSFREFSVTNGSEAFFNNPLDIRNIITRVTGQSPSDINGLIRANGAANLFLINPAGIVFGENAQLNIGGSFVGSTANSLLFDNGWEYSATNPNSPPLLTVNVPVGLQFGTNPGAIAVQGSGHGLTYSQIRTTIQDNVPALGVQTGKTFALVGGDIFIKGGNINAGSGKVFLGSVNSPDLVRFTVNDSDFAFEYAGVEKFGNIELSQKASVDVSGEGGGSIQIQGQRLSIKDGSSVLSITAGSQPGRDIVVNTTELVELIGESADGNYASSIFTESQGAGSSGNVTINTQKLTATGGAYVSTLVTSSGDGGELTVTAPQSVELSEIGIVPTRLSTRSSRSGSGSVGNLNIKTGSLIIKNGATVTSVTTGKGNAGEINIKTGELIAQEGGQLGATALSDEGQGGNLTIDATSFVELIGIGAFDDTVPSGLFTASGGKSNSGNAIIHTPSLRVLDGAVVSTNTFGAGRAGDLIINTDDLIVRDGRIITTTSGDGQAGNVTVNAALGVEVNGLDSVFSNGLFTTSSRKGNAGNLTINTPLLRVLNGATISANTFGTGRGGDLKITTGNGRVEVIGTSIDGFGSSIVTESGSRATGTAGSLTIKTGQLIARDGGEISASTFGKGQGGNLTIDAISSVELIGVNTVDSQLPSGLFATQNTRGGAETGKGNAGNLTVNTPLLRVLDGATVSTSTSGEGRGGDLKITTDQLLVRNASIRARSTGTGTAGNLTINAKNSINLDDKAILTTDTRSNGVDQAIININSPDLILRRGSNITTNATGTNVTGGNINIKTDNLALLESSNITANSTDARGGKINIQTQGLFQSPDSAITARGATQELSGTVNINSNLDPSSGLQEIPINLVDLSRQIASSCTPRTAQNRNSFTVTGRGGIPANSTELLHDTNTIATWVRRKPKPESEQPTTPQSSLQKEFIPQPIVEASNWQVDSRGQVHLVATNRVSNIPPQVNVCPN